MRTRTENLTDVVAPKANWPLALGAGLLGIGQNGLLVMLPQLVSLTGLSLSVWAGLLMFGSMLFLPASPWWGRQSERHGCKIVMLASLGGYLASFVVMALVVWAMANGALNALWGMAGLVLSRMLYGLTVSGLVPAAQTWAIQRAGLDKRMAALATISSGLSCGRLLGPPLAALLLLIAAVLMVAGLGLMSLASLAMFYVGIVITSLGAAMATPGYQLLLNDRLTTGKGAGVIATSHTLGYGASALLVPVVTRFYGEQFLITAAWGMALLFLAVSVWVRSTDRTP
ncbi:MFS transporter [Enterobacter hormaechei]